MLTSKCWLACCGHEETLKIIFLATKMPWEQPQSNGCTSFYCVLWNICFWSEQSYTSLLAVLRVYSNFAQIKWSFSIPFYVIVSCSTHWSLRHNYAAVSCNCLEGTDATATARDRGFKWSLPQELSKVFVSPSKSCSHCSRCQNRQKRTLKFCEFGGWIPRGSVIRKSL